MAAITCSQAALVYPGVHVRPFVFQVLNLKFDIIQLVFQEVDLVQVRFDRFIEGSCQWIRCSGHACGCNWHCRVITRRTVGEVSRGYSLVLLLLRRCCPPVRLEHVLRCLCARILGIFVRYALVVAGVGRRWPKVGHC